MFLYKGGVQRLSHATVGVLYERIFSDPDKYFEGPQLALKRRGSTRDEEKEEINTWGAPTGMHSADGGLFFKILLI